MQNDKFEINNIFPELYTAAQGKAKLVNAPSLRTLAINGEGEIFGPRYNDSVAALHAVAYGLKSMVDEGLTVDGYVNFTITALECLWSLRSGGDFDPQERNDAIWELSVVVPGFVTPRLVNIVQLEIAKRTNNNLISDVHVNTLQEKKSAQILHLGSLDKIDDDYKKLISYIKRVGYRPSSRFHEIYLNDPLTTKKSHLRTILRQPIVRIN